MTDVVYELSVFFFQAEDGIRDYKVTGVQTCALPISILHGRVPAGSVVVSGTLPAADGRYSLYCAVIVKRVDAQTRAKTSINDLLRGVEERACGPRRAVGAFSRIFR